MTEWLLLLLVGGAAAVAIGWPLLRRSANPARDEPVADAEALLVRHRLALEALRDVEADRRAGSLDAAAYALQREEAERRAAETLRALEESRGEAAEAAVQPAPGGGRRVVALLGGLLAVALLVGFALPPPLGLAERTVVNQPLADAIAREEARQDEIRRLLELLAADPRDSQALSDLADAYLAGPPADLPLAARMLQFLISQRPEDASAYRRLITAYITAGDWTDAGAALDAYAEIAADDEPDIPFFRGLIALRGNGDLPEAVRQFDRFLELAPDDPRAAMVRGLRDEAAEGASGG